MKSIETAKENQFYPTPREFLKKICEGIQWDQVHTILEPSAGKGDVVDYLVELEKEGISKAGEFGGRSRTFHENLKFDIDVIELDKNLQHILKGKEYKLVHDDFLSFSTYKRYDLIIMNPPFNKGVQHLMHAINIMERYGGNIICILNAETIDNPYSMERQELRAVLEKYHSDIQYYEEAFLYSENTTTVKTAVVKVCIPKKKFDSSFIKELRQQQYHDKKAMSKDELVSSDFIEAIIQQYNLELEGCFRLLEEYRLFKPYILNLVNNRYATPIIELKINGKADDNNSMNRIVELVRSKYWGALFQNPKFTKGMTSQQIDENMDLVNELRNYDFSYYNIKKFQIEMVQKRISGIKQCIEKLFDELSHEYSWLPETSRNIHYYNGWATNKAYLINSKVIIPFHDLWDNLFKKYRFSYTELKKLSDIEKVFDYLNGTPGRSSNLYDILRAAENCQQTKKIETRYFFLDFYKKGTCHIKFKDEELLKRFNIAGGRGKSWLPPCYGKKSYKQMTPEEKQVIDEFEGSKSYAKVMENPENYLFEVDSLVALPMLDQ